MAKCQDSQFWKISDLKGFFYFLPVRVLNFFARSLVYDNGRNLLEVTAVPRPAAFLRQRVIVAIQRGNGAAGFSYICAHERFRGVVHVWYSRTFS